MYKQINKNIISRKSIPNLTGIPDSMKEKAEMKSGLSLDNVRVHRNSDSPGQAGALAYTRGTDIFLGSGNERHLGHELGHVVQQMQGRVTANGSVNGMPLNDDSKLEQEADHFLD